MRFQHAAGFVLTLVTAMGLTSCQCSAPPASEVSAAPRSFPAVEVVTARVRRGSILQRISAPGSLVALRESRIGPEVVGRIERIFVAESDRVEAGDPLFQIDRSSYEMALRQAGAYRDRARAERRQVESDLKRARRLLDEHIIAETDIDKIATSLEVAGAVEREAEEAVALAENNLERTTVHAPYAGSISARFEDEGTTALVQPQTIILVIQEVSELEAQTTIPEVHVSTIRIGDPALLHVEGLPQPIRTEVSAVGDAIDPATRTYLVKMRVPNPDRRLKAGLFARVEIFPREKNDVIIVPRDAIRREDGRTSVLTVRDGKAVATSVQLGLIAEDDVEVLHGVRVDEEIVVGGFARSIAPGMLVRPVPSAPPGPAT